MAKRQEFQRRFYREWVGAKDLILQRICEKETDLQILTDKKIEKVFLRSQIRDYRWQIENYITRDPRFSSSLKPISVELNAPKIVRGMTQAAQKAGVGPMAAVAGAIAEFLGRDLLKNGCQEVIIENGGDIFLKSKKIRYLMIYAGKFKLWQKFVLKIKPQDTPLGICASSGTVGHSLSFGQADSVVILAKSSTLADAVATATANRLQNKKDISKALVFSKSVAGILGAVIIIENHLATWGKVEFMEA